MTERTVYSESSLHLERIRDYYELCKPRVVMLIVFTAVVGMFMATPGFVGWDVLIFGTLGITLTAAAAAAINQVVDRHVDERMFRTRKRPLVVGHLGMWEAVPFILVLGLVGEGMLYFLVNPLTALLTGLSLIGYAGIYTMYLKRATPQNIVIGGAAGAAPPILGWAAVTDQVTTGALLLFLIIFVWTPPHFWALAIERRQEYKDVHIPMLPVTHGVAFTSTQVLLYTILLVPVTVMPYLINMSGLLYLAGALLLDGGFLYYAVRLKFAPRKGLGMKTFGYSILYLMGIFALLLVDHYAAFLIG